MAWSSATLHALSVRFLAKTNGIVLNDIWGIENEKGA